MEKKSVNVGINVQKNKPLKPKKKRRFLLYFLIFILSILLVIKIFPSQTLDIFADSAYKSGDFETAAKIYKMVYNLDNKDKEALYREVYSLSKLPLTYENQKEIYRISQLDNNTAGEMLATNILKSYKAHLSLKIGVNYIENVVYNGEVIRWNVSDMPLTYYVEQSNVPQFYYEAVEKSFATWEKETFELVSFKKTDDPNADIRISFVDSNRENNGDCTEGNCEYAVGLTSPKIRNKSLLYMTITILKKTNLGTDFPADDMNVIAVHEIGHALGIWGHSNYKGSIMYYSADKDFAYGDKKDISYIDLNTLRLLYKLNPDITNSAITNLNRKNLIFAPILTESLNNTTSDEKINAAKEKLKNNPNDINNWIELSSIYAKKEDYEASITVLNDAIPYVRDNETLSVLYYNMTVSAINMKNYPKALQFAQAAYSTSGNIDSRILIAEIHSLQKNNNEAEQEFKQILNEDPSNIDAITAYTSACIREKNIFKARKILKDFVKTNPNAKNDPQIARFKILLLF
ncbi:MAG: matrixin family metalloprotease [Candidatus Gastranaerophilales bacterium]|nr:matrixin family metalloprotease [Candidatus Gastranaerophilales bacterium]